MASAEEDENKNKGPHWKARLQGSWRPVNKEIWAQHGEPPEGLHRVVHVLRRLAATFTHPFSAFILGTMAIGWSVIGTILAAYYIGGVRFFGTVFLVLWGAIIATGILMIEKMGYARNFEQWNYSLRKTIVLPLAFALTVAFLFLILLLGNHFR